MNGRGLWRCIGFSAITLLIILPAPLSALPTQSFQVSAAIVAGCAISGTANGVLGTLNFGTHPGVGTRTVNASYVQNATLTLACSPGTTLSMSINGGGNYTSTRNLRNTRSGELLPYRIFTNASYTAASEIPVDQSVSVTYSNANNIILPVYGQLQMKGIYRAGSYADNLTITLSW
ncbi:Spore coat protein U (SCPU) domain-containing protein [Izhakiella capsodis]|uniref:Spore coat protein U (SCPU) domain-containing protein n=1 Tax=Izhakiella capsodis TaxID=1367852 RepID=A0A1I4VYZ2_9GAMM|nr:spore coat U domain-containing protein [Izhakiella capsodis]SFN06169.1 Spore coat protein U (SCPU) domain-containing protein [Izhakiella capsodis]